MNQLNVLYVIDHNKLWGSHDKYARLVVMQQEAKSWEPFQNKYYNLILIWNTFKVWSVL